MRTAEMLTCLRWTLSPSAGFSSWLHRATVSFCCGMPGSFTAEPSSVNQHGWFKCLVLSQFSSLEAGWVRTEVAGVKPVRDVASLMGNFISSCAHCVKLYLDMIFFLTDYSTSNQNAKVFFYSISFAAFTDDVTESLLTQ